MRSALFVMLVLGACGKGDGKQEATSSDPPKTAPPKAAGLGTLEVKINGKSAPMKKAFIKRIPGAGRYQVHAVDGDGSCQELIDNVFNNRDLPYILFNIGQRLGADGKLRTEVTEIFIKGSGTVEPGSMATVGGTADNGTKVDVSVLYKGSNEGTVHEVSGTLVAEGCGERAEPALLKSAHPSTATITIAGQKRPIMGARRTKDRFLLTTGAIDCSPSTPFAEAILLKQYGSWELGGTWFTQATKDKDKEMEKVIITPGAAGTSDDGPTVSLALSGEGTMAGHPVTLDGTIEALDCPDS